MNTTKKTYALSVLVLLASMPTHTRTDDGTRLAIGIIGVAGALGLYGAYNWLVSESDEEALDTARQRMMEYKSEYRQSFNALGIEADHALSAGQIQRFIEHLNEGVLYQLAKIKHNKPTIIVYRNQVENMLRDVRASYTDLGSRIVGQDDYMLREQLRCAERELKSFVDELEMLVTLLRAHQSYFELYEVETKFGVAYAEELRVLASYLNNLDNQAWAIRQFVIARSKASSLPFPRVEYRKILDRDIQQLEHAFNRSSRHYTDRMGRVRQLIDTLKAIKSFVVSDVLYPQEVANYEHDQREKERIRIEQEKAEAERRKAEAEERKARAERDRVWIEEQKLLEQRKENRRKQRERELQDVEDRRARRYGY